MIPLVGRGEAELGIANALEVAVAVEGARLPDLRLIGAIHPLPTAYFVRKDTPMKTIADLKGKKVVFGFSAQRVLDTVSRAILAAGGLTEKDISPVLVPNVIRGADDFVAGAADTFYFAFGAPKVREVDATVGGIRVLEIPDSGMAAARNISEGYLSPAAPGPFFIGVDKPTGVYTWDNLLFTNAKVKDEQVYKIIEAMAKNKDDLVAIQPALRSFTAAGLYKNYGVPYHPGALKYFNDNKMSPRRPAETQIFHPWGKPCPSLPSSGPPASCSPGSRSRPAPRPRRPTASPPCSPARSPTRRVRHRQGAEGKGRPQHAGAAHRRRNRAHPHGRARARSISASPTCWRWSTASRPAGCRTICA